MGIDVWVANAFMKCRLVRVVALESVANTPENQPTTNENPKERRSAIMDMDHSADVGLRKPTAQ